MPAHRLLPNVGSAIETTGAGAGAATETGTTGVGAAIEIGIAGNAVSGIGATIVGITTVAAGIVSPAGNDQR